MLASGSDCMVKSQLQKVLKNLRLASLTISLCMDIMLEATSMDVYGPGLFFVH